MSGASDSRYRKRGSVIRAGAMLLVVLVALSPASAGAWLAVDDDNAGGIEDGSVDHPYATVQALIRRL